MPNAQARAHQPLSDELLEAFGFEKVLPASNTGEIGWKHEGLDVIFYHPIITPNTLIRAAYSSGHTAGKRLAQREMRAALGVDPR